MTREKWLTILETDPAAAYAAKWRRAWVRQTASEVGLKVTARTPITPGLLRDIADRRLAARDGLMSRSELKEWLNNGWRITDVNTHIYPHVKLPHNVVHIYRISHGTLTWYIKRLTPQAAQVAQKIIAKLYSD